jgi:putative transposase
MSWVRIWVHLVFSTKNREPFLNTEVLRRQFFQHVKHNTEVKKIWIDQISGYADHIHCLISLRKDQSISNVAQLIKGESSYWINKSALIKNKFSWQDDYWAVSVSESHLDKVRQYIQSQEDHHRSVSFADEVSEFMERYGWTLIKGNED